MRQERAKEAQEVPAVVREGAPPGGWILGALLNDDHPPRRNYDKCGSHNGELCTFQECA